MSKDGNLDETVHDRVQSAAATDRELKLGSFAEGFMRWLLTLDVSQDENEVTIKTKYRTATEEHPFDRMVVNYRISQGKEETFLVEAGGRLRPSGYKMQKKPAPAARSPDTLDT